MPWGGCEGLCLGKSLRKTAALTGKAVALLSCRLTSFLYYLHSAFIPLPRPETQLQAGGQATKNRIIFMNPEVVPEEQSPKADELKVAPAGTDTELRERRFGA